MLEGGGLMRNIIELDNVVFSYNGGTEILPGIDLKINEGSIYGLVGKNGAGKTTLIQIILGLLKPERGEVSIAGKELKELEPGKIGYLPERPYYHPDFRLEEYLKYLSLITTGKVENRIDEMIKLVSLEDYRREWIKNFSKGMLQRLGLAQSFLNNPDLLILDEPMSGLDPVGQNKMRDIILEINAKGTSILLTSHNLYEIERICDSFGILHKGIINPINRDEIIKEIEIELNRNLEKEETIKKSLHEMSVDVCGNRVILAVDDDIYFEVMKILLNNRIKIISMNRSLLRLEKVVLEYLEDSDHDG